MVYEPTEKESPHPQASTTFGFLNVNFELKRIPISTYNPFNIYDNNSP